VKHIGEILNKMFKALAKKGLVGVSIPMVY
jgi:hypothetical protein